MALRSYLQEAAPFAAMVFVEIGEVAITTLTKAAMNKGISIYVFVVYYSWVAVLILLPYAIFNNCFRRKERAPPITFSLLRRFFVLGLFGKCLAFFSYAGLNYSTPLLTAALGNLTPIYTFLFAILLGLETLNIRSPSFQAKSLGTIVAVSGAFVISLYKGPTILHSLREISSNASHLRLLLAPQSNWVLGGLFLAIGFLVNSIWSVLQAETVQKYPDQANVVFFFVLFGTIQCSVVALILERDLKAWTSLHRIEIIAILYTGIFGTTIRVIIDTWCLNKKGPLYVALFRPLGMVIAEICGILFLGDSLYVGSLIGAIIIAMGFYAVMWGKAKEADVSRDVHDVSKQLETSTENTPLLQDSPKV